MASVTVDKTTGRVQIRAYAGVDKRTHKKRNLYVSLPAGSSQEDIDAACRELDERAAKAKEMGFGTDLDSMAQRYFAICDASGYAPSTVQSYRSDYRTHVQPYLGSCSVSEIHPWDVAEMFMELADSGRADGMGLSESTRAKLYAWLNAFFKWMVGEGHVISNPLEGVKRVYPSGVEAEPIDEFDLRKLYAWIAAKSSGWDEESFKKIVWLDLSTGMRRGEICGLQVGDLRTGAHEIAISRALTEAGGLHYKKPKSKTSIRRISINQGVTSGLTAYLHAQRDMLETHGMEQRATTPLFSHSDGSPWRPSELTQGFGALREDLGLSPGVHFHSMRHTHASQLLADGCDIRTLQERLGHSSVNTTLRIYGHVLPGRDRAAADTWARHEERLARGS